MDNQTPLTAWGQQWLTDPDGGGYFLRQRDAIRAHNPSCEGLANVWLPRKHGYSALSDLMECDACGLTFFWEGLRVAFKNCPESNHWYCPCCLAKATTCPCQKQEEACPSPSSA